MAPKIAIVFVRTPTLSGIEPKSRRPAIEHPILAHGSTMISY